MPRFSDIAGQDVIIKELKNNIKSKRVSHAYLFSGEEGVGKKLTAMAFAQALNCENRIEEDSCSLCPSCRRAEAGRHEAISYVQPTGNSFKIEQIRELQKEISLGAVSSFYRILIMEDAHLLTKEAANALLKLLEEPPAKVVFILLTPNFSAILPTIVSRCRHLTFKRIKPKLVALKLENEFSLAPEESLFLAHLSQGSFGRAVEMVQKKEEIFSWREQTEDILLSFWNNSFTESFFRITELEAFSDLKIILNLMELFCRDLLLSRSGEVKIVANRDRLNKFPKINTPTEKVILTLHEIQSIRKFLRYNVNKRLALDVFYWRVNDLNKEVKTDGNSNRNQI